MNSVVVVITTGNHKFITTVEWFFLFPVTGYEEDGGNSNPFWKLDYFKELFVWPFFDDEIQRRAKQLGYYFSEG